MKKRYHNLKFFTCLASTVFVSVLLLSQVSTVQAGYNFAIGAKLAEANEGGARASAQRLYDEGVKLFGQGTTESLRQAISTWQEALKLWQQVDDKSQEASTLNSIALVYDQLGEKQEALKYYNQALPLFRAVDDRREEAYTLKNIGLVHDDLGDNKQALDFYNQAFAIQKANNYLPEQADALASIALKYQLWGKEEKALDYYQQALTIYRQTKNLPKQAKTLASIGLLYADKGDRKQTEKSIQQVLELQKTIPSQLQQNEITQIDTLNNLRAIAISYSRLGDTKQQIFYLKQGRIIAHELGKTQDEAQFISSIGNAYYNLGETQKAKDNLTQALKLQREIKDYEGEAQTLIYIASIDTKSGEFQQALDQLNQALPISKQKRNIFLEGQILLDMSDVYRDLGAYELSIETNKKVLVLYQKSASSLVRIPLLSIGTSYLASCSYQKKPEDCDQSLHYFNQALKYAREKANVFQEITTLPGIATAYYTLKKYPQAIINGKRALELSRKYNLEAQENHSLIILSGLYEGAGDYQNALDASKQSLLLSQKRRNLPSLATTYERLGKIYASMKQPQQAIEAYNQQLKLAKQIGDTFKQTYPLYKIAIIERDRKNFNQAKTNIETVINIIEQTRSKVTSQDLRSSYFATVQDYYEFYVDLLMQMHKQNPSKGYDALALHANERSRARGLVELLAEANAKIRKGVDPKLLASEQLLLDKIDAIQKQIQEIAAKPNTEARIEALKKESENLLNQHRELKTQIRTSSPEYAALKYPEPLELKQIQQQLDPDTVLLQYSLGKDRSYLWAVTPDSLQAYELPAQKQIEDAANNFLDDIQQAGTPYGKDNPDQVYDAAVKTAYQLSQMIMKPVADKLGKKRLVIVANGVLQSIPFAALADPMSKADSTYQPLIVNHEIANLPSVTAIATQRRQLNNRKPASKTLAVLADPVFESNDIRLTGFEPAPPEFDLNRSSLQRALKNLKRNGLERLDGTRQEAKDILKLVPPQESIHAYDFDANYNFVNSPELKQYRFLLFATHGFVDTTNPEMSGIVLSQFDNQGKPVKQGYLNLANIFNLDLNAELVVLSACETGLGKDVKGEGLMGLTRGLMYAGSKRAVVSLWKVSDKGTSQLMPKFYSSVFAGKSPTTALRDAQLQLWQEKTWQNPYYWSAFTLQGDWR
jgi:CHAT domain-containing protein/tetratricopeptide (TPR) repeat protein